MGAEELVRRAGEEIAAQLLYVGCDVRHRLYGVDVRHGTGSPRSATDRGDVIDRAGQIAGRAHADETRALAEEVVEDSQVKLESVEIEWQPSDLEAQITRH